MGKERGIAKQVRDLRRDGKSIDEICTIVDYPRREITRICRKAGMSVTPEERKIAKDRQDHAHTHDESWAKQYIEEKADGRFVYESGYVNMDSTVIVSCVNCGKKQSRRFSIFRGKGHPVCLYCEFGKKNPKDNPERIHRREQRAKEKEREKEQQLLDQEHKRIEREERKYINASGRQRSFLLCDCGSIMGSKSKHCIECTNRAQSKRREIVRRRKVSAVIVDKDITLNKLFIRDHGICHICGKPCDYTDKEERPNTIVCGNNYPSIDHVIPLAKGGLHSWDNVKLAHRICNSLKGDDYDEENMENTDNEGNGESGDLPRVI